MHSQPGWTFYGSKLIGVLCTVNQGEPSMVVITTS